jgi:hypothetical protein
MQVYQFPCRADEENHRKSANALVSAVIKQIHRLEGLHAPSALLLTPK